MVKSVVVAPVDRIAVAAVMLSPPARKAILTRVQKSLSIRASCSGDQVEGASSRRASAP
jgi:hypothetical protein